MTNPAITILMGVLNGARHLPDQLQSLSGQTHQNWQLVCSDDGSTDASLQTLDQFARNGRRVCVSQGPARGFSANYMTLIRDLPPAPGLVAFSDQDDIWLPDKLTRAVTALQPYTDVPTLYCARRWDWYPDTNRKFASALPRRAVGFQNALVENIAAGNTIVLNGPASALARDAARHTGPVFAHDWWLYLLISGVGGRIVFDQGPPVLLYRQHNANAIGCGRGVRQKWHRKMQVITGQYADRINTNIAALDQCRDRLTPTNRALMDRFTHARTQSLYPRLTGFHATGAFRQSRSGNLALWGAAGLGRV